MSYDKIIEPNLNPIDLGKDLKIRRLKVSNKDGDIYTFKQGQYNKTTGQAIYTIKKMPFIIDKLQHLHKAKSADPLFFLNIFFGVSLLFYVISSFWMFAPSSSVFRKGIYFTAAGIILTLILLFV